jgi:tRNA pseudouridine38-40 synthase
MNYRLTLQYDGTDFHGWQMQEGRRTVQGELTRVLSLLEGEPVIVHGAGRTDAGVHAEAQVASFRLRRQITPERLRGALNGNLDWDVRAIEVEVAPEEFHARFSARSKTYVYRIFNAPFISPFWRRYALHEARPVDLERMRQAARFFLGTHDWTAFSAAQTEARSRVRTVTELEIEERWSMRGRGRLIEIKITANGFLRYMVRSIVGTLLEIGRGEMELETPQRALLTGERELVGATAPAHGLTLVHVDYAETMAGWASAGAAASDGDD